MEPSSDRPAEPPPGSVDEAGETTEFPAQASAPAPGPELPVATRDLRDQLPGLEPERHLTDWGRSHRFEGFVDRVLYDFLYHYWFRVEVEGLENIPERGALLIGNHSGAVPYDGPMVAKAIREQAGDPRPVHLSVTGSLAGMPGLGMIVTKLGGVTNHPANLHRLLYDEQELVVVFPEGPVGARKAVARRYRMRGFDPGFVEIAAGAGVPIVPVAVLGAEEASPIFARLDPVAALARLPGLPLTTPLPLPAKFRLRFLEPVSADGVVEDPGGPPHLAEEIRALIQENLLEMVGERRSVWLG